MGIGTTGLVAVVVAFFVRRCSVTPLPPLPLSCLWAPGGQPTSENQTTTAVVGGEWRANMKNGSFGDGG